MRRSRSRSDDDVDAVDVLLVEDDDGDVAVDEVRAVLHELALEAMARRATWAADPHTGGAPEPPETHPEPPAGPLPRLVRRYRGRAVTAAVLVGAVAITSAVVDARRTAARAAALAASPAVLAELAGPPSPVWRVPGRIASDQHDVLLVVHDGSLRSVDPATGAVTWTASAAAGRAASSGHCFPVDEALHPGRAPGEDAAGPPGLVACVAQDPAGTGPDAPGDPGVVVLDAGTGRTRHTVPTGGVTLLAEAVGRDLLVAVALADGRVRVSRWDLAVGAPRWDRASPAPVLAGGAPEAVQRRPDSLVVGDFAVDLATGEPVDAATEREEPYPYEEHVLPGGARATWSWLPGGTSGRGRVTGGEAQSFYFLPGPPLRPPVTDGSDLGVLVVQTADRHRLRGLDLRGGRMTWTQPSPGGSAVRATALVDGVMLLDDGPSVTAVSVRTGDGVWRAHADTEVTGGAALTDGRTVLLPLRDDDGSLHLHARVLADGTTAWRSEVPAGTERLTVVDRHLVASTGAGLVGLG